MTRLLYPMRSSVLLLQVGTASDGSPRRSKAALEETIPEAEHSRLRAGGWRLQESLQHVATTPETVRDRLETSSSGNASKTDEEQAGQLILTGQGSYFKQSPYTFTPSCRNAVSSAGKSTVSRRWCHGRI